MVVVVVCIGIFTFLLKNEEKILKENLELVSLNEEEQVSREIVQNVNEKLTALQTRTHLMTPVEVVGLILRNKNQGITLNSFDFTSAREGGSLKISGIADAREDLISFFKNLESEEVIQTVESPISNLSRSNDISFTADILITNNEE